MGATDTSNCSDTSAASSASICAEEGRGSTRGERVERAHFWVRGPLGVDEHHSLRASVFLTLAKRTPGCSSASFRTRLSIAPPGLEGSSHAAQKKSTCNELESVTRNAFRSARVTTALVMFLGPEGAAAAAGVEAAGADDMAEDGETGCCGGQ